MRHKRILKKYCKEIKNFRQINLGRLAVFVQFRVYLHIVQRIHIKLSEGIQCMGELNIVSRGFVNLDSNNPSYIHITLCSMYH